MNTGYVDTSVLPGYLTAVVLICIAPGPDMAYMVATGIGAGRSAATRAALGVTSGVVIYAIAVAAGLGAIVGHDTGVLTVLEIFGAAYLAWLAYSTFRDARDAQPTTDQDAGDQQAWFRRGLVVNLTNPKVLLFFIAFLPQFLGQSDHPVLQLLMLGLIFQTVGLIIDLIIGWTAGSFRDKVLSRPGAQRAMTYTSAANISQADHPACPKRKGWTVTCRKRIRGHRGPRNYDAGLRTRFHGGRLRVLDL